MDIVGPTSAKMSGKTEPVLDALHREFLPKGGFRLDTHSSKKFDSQQLVGNDAAPGAK